MRTNFMFDDFLIELNEAKQAVLLLDYDGTLAPFAIERDQAVPYQGVRKLLSKIRQDTNTRLIIISGRRSTIYCRCWRFPHHRKYGVAMAGKSLPLTGRDLLSPCRIKRLPVCAQPAAGSCKKVLKIIVK